MIIADNSPATYDQVRKNYRIILYGTLLLFGGIAVVHSFWLYSRFTVDDAFITWRYGKNLVEHGIWNYNPTTLDLTQSYTNPIYAILSIIPAFFAIDVVFFFKIVATLKILVFSVWFLRITQLSWLMILLLLSIPATIVHAYSGLETFLFVALVSALFISLDKNQRLLAIVLTWLLFLTRPESWLLVVLVPTFFAVEEPKQHSGFGVKQLKQFILSLRFSFKRFFCFLLFCQFR